MDIEVGRVNDVQESQSQCLTQVLFKFLESILLVRAPLKWFYGVPL
jgi:hypothetical protein